MFLYFFSNAINHFHDCFHTTPLLMIFRWQIYCAWVLPHAINSSKHIIKINFLSWCCFLPRSRTNMFSISENAQMELFPSYFFFLLSLSFFSMVVFMTFWFPYQKIYSLNTFVTILVFDNDFFSTDWRQKSITEFFQPSELWLESTLQPVFTIILMISRKKSSVFL